MFKSIKWKVLSPNRFEQLTVEGWCKKVNVSEVNLNLNYSSRPRKIANSQTHLTTHKRPTTVVNSRPENQDIYESKKVVPGRQTYGETIGKRSNNIAIFGASETSVDIIKIFLIKKSKIVKQDSNIFQAHCNGIYCTM